MYIPLLRDEKKGSEKYLLAAQAVRTGKNNVHQAKLFIALVVLRQKKSCSKQKAFVYIGEIGKGGGGGHKSDTLRFSHPV